ncbi:MAG: hypothetical protein PVJ57_18900 [Phycisphaerae bacterium]
MTDNFYDDYGVERSSLSASEPLGAHEVYVADFVGPFVLVPTQDFTGKLRLVRSGGTQTGYYHNAGEWIPIRTASAPTEDIAIQLHAWSHNYAFQHHDVRAAFDNFTVTTGQVVWIPEPTTLCLCIAFLACLVRRRPKRDRVRSDAVVRRGSAVAPATAHLRAAGL